MVLALESETPLNVGIVAEGRAELGKSLLVRRPGPDPDPEGGVWVWVVLQGLQPRRLFPNSIPDARLGAIELHPRVSPQSTGIFNGYTTSRFRIPKSAIIIPSCPAASRLAVW